MLERAPMSLLLRHTQTHEQYDDTGSAYVSPRKVQHPQDVMQMFSSFLCVTCTLAHFTALHHNNKPAKQVSKANAFERSRCQLSRSIPWPDSHHGCTQDNQPYMHKKIVNMSVVVAILLFTLVPADFATGSTATQSEPWLLGPSARMNAAPSRVESRAFASALWSRLRSVSAHVLLCSRLCKILIERGVTF